MAVANVYKMGNASVANLNSKLTRSNVKLGQSLPMCDFPRKFTLHRTNFFMSSSVSFSVFG